jgi:hypothetical protein
MAFAASAKKGRKFKKLFHSAFSILRVIEFIFRFIVAKKY